MTRRNRNEVESRYSERYSLLEQLASCAERRVADYLEGLPHVDRVYFRAKTVDSFVEKAMATNDGEYKYAHPFEQIEDQVAGRVLVFMRSDVDASLEVLHSHLRKADWTQREPESEKEFDYETHHTICLITPDLKPKGWDALQDPPETFELQVRTLAQHAWAEVQHDFYKHKGGLSREQRKKLYFAAGMAWGLDSIWEELRPSLNKLESDH